MIAVVAAALLTATPSIDADVAPAAPIWSVPVAHTAGVMAGMRLSLSVLWPEPYAPLPLARTSRSFGRAYTSPPAFDANRSWVESDGDPWLINVVGHGLFGAEAYGRARQCGAGPLAALAFAAGASAVWEYGVESWNKPPSGVDLVLTPLLGMALGEARVQTQRWLRSRPRSTWRRALEIAIDPLGEGERGLLHTRC